LWPQAALNGAWVNLDVETILNCVGQLLGSPRRLFRSLLRKELDHLASELVPALWPALVRQ
jgi:hypothetical protein